MKTVKIRPGAPGRPFENNLFGVNAEITRRAFWRRC